jgi:hypothetical protein
LPELVEGNTCKYPLHAPLQATYKNTHFKKMILTLYFNDFDFFKKTLLLILPYIILYYACDGRNLLRFGLQKNGEGGCAKNAEYSQKAKIMRKHGY